MKVVLQNGSQQECVSNTNTGAAIRQGTRGFEFTPIDLTKAYANKFQIIDGKIMPSLSAIDGLGEKAVDLVEQASRDGSFLSKDDFKIRTKVSQTLTDKIYELGILGDVPESNQISLLDFMNMKGG